MIDRGEWGGGVGRRRGGGGGAGWGIDSEGGGNHYNPPSIGGAVDRTLYKGSTPLITQTFVFYSE